MNRRRTRAIGRPSRWTRLHRALVRSGPVARSSSERAGQRASVDHRVDRDYARARSAEPSRAPRLSRRVATLSLLGAVLAALAIVAVRVRLIDQSYALASAMKRERALLEKLRVLTAQRRVLRDPVRLAALAPELGLDRPERLITLDPPGRNERRP